MIPRLFAAGFHIEGGRPRRRENSTCVFTASFTQKSCQVDVQVSGPHAKRAQRVMPDVK
jgi:hypothetical protein